MKACETRHTAACPAAAGARCPYCTHIGTWVTCALRMFWMCGAYLRLAGNGGDQQRRCAVMARQANGGASGEEQLAAIRVAGAGRGEDGRRAILPQHVRRRRSAREKQLGQLGVAARTGHEKWRRSIVAPRLGVGAAVEKQRGGHERRVHFLDVARHVQQRTELSVHPGVRVGALLHQFAHRSWVAGPQRFEQRLLQRPSVRAGAVWHGGHDGPAAEVHACNGQLAARQHGACGRGQAPG